jgi:hypothetical protein
LSEVVPTTPPAEALIVVVPMDTGDASPVLLMVATLVVLEFHAADTLPTVPSEKVAEAANCCVCPAEIEMLGFDGVTVMAVIVLVLTVMRAVAVTLLLFDLAVRVEVPSATAVTSPEVLTVAILVAEEVHAT